MIQTPSYSLDLKSRTHIMGVLNVTPDSFSDGGKFSTIENGVKQAQLMENEGADIIDVGGESTRPDHSPISSDDELERIIPVIEAIRDKVSVPISVDTYKAETARQAIETGAEMINDVWGAKQDPEIAQVAASHHVPIILMHNRADKNYDSLIDDMKKDFQESIDIALKAGVPSNGIILDPGIGFGKTVDHNFQVMNHLEMFHELGYPLLLGTSRKSFIKRVLPDTEAEERDNATGATTCLGIEKGVQIVRVHDVERHKELALMMDAMKAAVL